MCGAAIPQEPASHYPREGFDEELSEAGPEIADINPRIPANEYAPPIRERFVEPEPPVRYEPEPEETQPISREPAYVAPRNEEPHPRSSTSIFDLEPRESERPKFETDPRAVKPVSYGNNMFSYDPVAADRERERAATTVHGPSFLGLSDPDFLDEIDEPPSHARRNWLVVALIVVVGIAAVEWRNIRNTGMQYAGTMHLSLPNKKGQDQAKLTPEQTAPTASGETSAAGEGKPEIVVGQTNASSQPPSATNNPANAGTIVDNSKAAGAEPTQNATPAGDKKSAEAADKKGTEEVAANKPDQSPVKVKADTTGADGDEAADDTPAAKPSRVVKSAGKRPSKFVDDSAGTAGDDDLARAEKASDPATAANWLWAATKKGNTEAPVRLADFYANGRGVPKDCEQATVLLKSSARRGNPRARARLGMYYATGQCVAQDRAQAWHWLSLAHQADPGSDWIEQYRQRLWTQMTPDERSRSNASSTASE